MAVISSAPLAYANSPPNELSKRHELVQELLSWVLNSLVFPLLRDLFYITECEGAANEIVFFQRSIWKVIRYYQFALHDLVSASLKRLRWQ